jgi:uncharacterized membrane protein
MIRNYLKGDKMVSEHGFRYRGISSSRLEGLTDAVFGFAITLLVVSLQVPGSFLELQASMYGFLGFVLATMVIFMFWNEHYEFFLRYGLEDSRTKFLNFIFLFLVLFYVYPLKFLFNILGTLMTLIISNLFNDHSAAHALKVEEFKENMMLSNQDWFGLLIGYGIGLILIYLVFYLLYKNALKFKNELELNELEVFETKVSLYSFAAMAIIPVLSIILLFILPDQYQYIAGFIYCSFGIVVPVYYTQVNKKRKALGFKKTDKK